jgi:hypothetical protein
MFGWIAKKITENEIAQDVNGLKSLPPQTRLVASTKVLSIIQDAYECYEDGDSMIDVQQVLSRIRKERCAEATGYNDPNHLIGSLPDHFFISFSPKFEKSEENNRRKLILYTLKDLISTDSWSLLSKFDASMNMMKIEGFEKKLTIASFI